MDRFPIAKAGCSSVFMYIAHPSSPTPLTLIQASGISMQLLQFLIAPLLLTAVAIVSAMPTLGVDAAPPAATPLSFIADELPDAVIPDVAVHGSGARVKGKRKPVEGFDFEIGSEEGKESTPRATKSRIRTIQFMVSTGSLIMNLQLGRIPLKYAYPLMMIIE